MSVDKLRRFIELIQKDDEIACKISDNKDKEALDLYMSISDGRFALLEAGKTVYLSEDFLDRYKILIGVKGASKFGEDGALGLRNFIPKQDIKPLALEIVVDSGNILLLFKVFKDDEIIVERYIPLSDYKGIDNKLDVLNLLAGGNGFQPIGYSLDEMFERLKNQQEIQVGEYTTYKDLGLDIELSDKYNLIQCAPSLTGGVAYITDKIDDGSGCYTYVLYERNNAIIDARWEYSGLYHEEAIKATNRDYVEIQEEVLRKENEIYNKLKEEEKIFNSIPWYKDSV